MNHVRKSLHSIIMHSKSEGTRVFIVQQYLFVSLLKHNYKRYCNYYELTNLDILLRWELNPQPSPDHAYLNKEI